MGIMGCYPDRRAVENELGGKWELFFEETLDESGNVGYEWDEDFDGTPLNLNGILILVKQNGVDAKATHSTRINGIRELNLQNSTAINDNLVTFIKSTISNGLLDSYGKTRNVESGVGVGQWHCGISNQFISSITSFDYSTKSLPAGANIKIYVLRGV